MLRMPEEQALGLRHHGDGGPGQQGLGREAAQIDEGEILTPGNGQRTIRLGPGGDGRLEFVRKYDLEAGSEQLFWMGMVSPAA